VASSHISYTVYACSYHGEDDRRIVQCNSRRSAQDRCDRMNHAARCGTLPDYLHQMQVYYWIRERLQRAAVGPALTDQRKEG